MERFWLKKRKLLELTQPGWGDAADYFRKRDREYGTTELKFPAVIQSLTNQVAVVPPLTTSGELIETLDIVPGILQMPQGTSQPGSSHMRLRSGKLQMPERISSLPPGVVSDSLQLQYTTQVEPVRFYHCILPPEPITI